MTRILSYLLAFLLLGGMQGQAQVNADFTYSIAEGCGSLQVSFCDNSTSSAGTIVAWSWNLAGATSSLECPGRIFSNPGTYTICLTATDDQGNSDQECKTDLIVVHEIPIANFTASPTTGCLPLQVVFSDLSQATNVPIVSWEWNLGGNCGIVTNTNNAPVSCSYDTPGLYSVSLTITDANGCTATTTQDNLIEVFDHPDIQFSADVQSACTGPLAVTFTNDNPEANVVYTWDFGNGQNFTGVQPGPINYTQLGTYTVSLTGENTQTGCRETKTIADYIELGFPMEMTISDTVICLGESITFRDVSPNTSTSRLWDFGDGNTSIKKTVDHTYNVPGCYPITLTREVDGCMLSISSSVCIQVLPLPSVGINNDNSIGCALPHVVNFAAVAPFAQDWFWDFGDGNTSVLTNPTHLYNAYDTFTVSLTVVDANGCSNTFSDTRIVVQEVEAILETEFFEGCAPLDMVATEISNSVTPIVDWAWQVTTNAGVYTSNGSPGMLSIPDTGIWDLTLVVTNTLGCMDTRTFPDAVSVGATPTVDFKATPLEECIDLDIRFMDLSSDYGEEWLWIFGDGEESLEQHPVHQYQDTGYYDVSLSVSHNGCVNTQTFTDYIHILEPLAKFDFDYDCTDPFTRNFIDRSIGAEVVHWDFGVPGIVDDTSDIWNPSYTYPGPGVYTVIMEVYNASTTCSHLISEQIEITLPSANFTVNTRRGCVPLTVQIQESSNFADEWEWLAPGGSISNPNARQPSITYATPGTYTDIRLVINDINNCRDTFLFTDTIWVNEVDAAFDFQPAGGCLPLTVNFEDQSTSLFGTTNQWSWVYGSTLGNGSGANTSFVFDTTGQFQVKLTVRDDWACFATLTVPNAVEVTQPVADFSTVDTLSCTWHCVRFDNLSQGLELNYLWDFGDGQTSADASPEYCYAGEGNYTVCLTVSDKYGCDSTLCKNNYIEIRNPVADFSADPTAGSCPPLTVNFSNQAQNASQFLWDFGDGSDSSELLNPSHVYITPRIFDVQLIAINTPFCQDTLTIPGMIELLGPTGDFTFTVDSSCAPTKVTFIGQSLDDYQYIWDFGDGTSDTTFTFQNSDTLTHIYTLEGDYWPILTLVDKGACSRSFDMADPIHISDISIDFFTPDTLLCGTNSAILFSNLSFSQDLIHTFEWQFPGGMPALSNELEPLVNFPGDGRYDVQLVAVNEYCRDTLLRENYIQIGPLPTADFTMDVSDGCNPLMVHFNDQSVLPGGNIVRWEWDFGDGQTSSLASPVHVYHTSGLIEVNLRVFSAIGCSDERTQQINIWQPLEVDTEGTQTICLGETITLSASFDGDTTGMTFYWEDENGLLCSQCLEYPVSPTDTTTYHFVVIDPQFCISEASTTVNVLPVALPVIDILPDTSICYGALVQLYASGGNAVFSYQWDTSRLGLNCYDYCSNPVAKPLASTTYVLTVTNEAGCSSQDSVRVEVLETETAFAGSDRTICEGQSVQFDITLGTNPQWLRGAGLSCTNCPNPIAIPDSSSSYVVQVVQPNGCQARDTIEVEVVPLDAVDAGADQVICRGSQAILSGLGEGIVSWSPANLVNEPTVLQTTALLSEATTFYLSVAKGECLITDSLRIEVQDKTNIEGASFTICQGDSVELNVSGWADSYLWSPSNSLSSATSAKPIAFPNQSTDYTVVASSSTCEADTTIVEVEVLMGPAFNWYPVYEFFPGQTVDLDIALADTVNYDLQWMPTEIFSCENCTRVTAFVTNTTPISLKVTDRSTACSYIYKSQLQLLDACSEDLIQMPTAFSPNGDGANDRLEIFRSPALDQITRFQVFNRWGDLVYSTTNTQNQWDGTSKGQIMPIGVYVYLVEATCPLNGKAFQKTGDILLVR